MISTTSPPAPSAGDGSEDIDRLLGRFFRVEVPRPWPALAAPVSVTVIRVRSPLSAGRMALAASIAALLACGWLLSGRLPGPAPTGSSLDNGSATVPHDLRGGTPPNRR